MMKILYVVVIALLTANCKQAYASFNWNGASVSSINGASVSNFNGVVVGSGSSITPIWSEDWSGTDPNWSIVLGTPNTNYTATISGLTEDLFVPARTNVEDIHLERSFTMTTPGSIYNARFKMKCTDVPTATGTRALASFLTGTSSRASFSFGYSSGAKLQTQAATGGTLVVASKVFEANTEYWIHVRGQKGSGTDAKASVGFSTTWPCPTSANEGYAESLNGNNTADPTVMKVGGDNYSSTGSSYNCEIGTIEYWETTTW